MRFVFLFLGLLVVAAVPAWAGLEEDLEALRAEAIAIPGAVVTEFPDFTMVEDRASLAFHYFTKPTHYAHPAAIRRAVVEEGGIVFIAYGTWPDGMETASKAFRAWMEEFAVLDEAVVEYFQQDRID